MRLPWPSSFGYFRLRLSVFDLVWAAIAPLLALYLRDAYILTAEHATLALLYCSASLTFSIIAFLAFRLSEGMSRFFSVHDALNVIKAVVTAQLMTGIVLFSLTRLEGIPRSTPIVHLVILAAGLFAARLIVLLATPERKVTATNHHSINHAIIIGATELAALYIKFTSAYAAGRRRIGAILDPDPKLIGRAIAGVPIVAPPQNLESVIDEFVVHGIYIDRVLIGGDRNLLPHAQLKEISRVCEKRHLYLDFVSQVVGLHDFPALQPHAVPQFAQARNVEVALQQYFQFKRLIDFFGALAAIIILSPLFVFTALLVLIDVGTPVLFWQQRIGQNACSFLLYKFRTLRSPFDWRGNPVPEHKRMSWIGKLIRKIRLDELPQLFNVLVGDMSLIGPRPLLPEDQPNIATVRLTVRPGITGWAQINGANLITADEKGALDDWYVRHASLSLDLRIAASTVRFFVTGEKRSEAAVTAAKSLQSGYPREHPAHRMNGLHAVPIPAGVQAPPTSNAVERQAAPTMPRQ